MSVARAQARINVAAIERNCSRLCKELHGGAALCAVVKADGYGHGAVQSATAALAGGASSLAVASAEEARELREAGVRVPVLVMGALSPSELAEALDADAEVVVWREEYLKAVAAAGGGRVHVKFDSGMGRLGTRDAAEASRVVQVARRIPAVQLVGVMTHFATADDLKDDGFFMRQLATFANWARAIKAEQPDLVVHAANSAATLRDREAQFDMVRCGIAVYGMDPFGRDPGGRGLEPAMELSSYVAEVKLCMAGESTGYGRRFTAEHDTYLGVLPIGYGDGWRRGLSNNADVLVGGRRYPLVGTVSMDNITVDLGADHSATNLRGERAILIGFQGTERVTAEEVARRLDTINYEVTCAITPRVPRSYHRDGRPLEEGAPSGSAQALTNR
ncbi:MAG TPA: alanine racemase [Solirubrobacteraceae bacterium]|jgi:alanine racemase|nr:alanine racemase [Solirubrobacteraceae bacterium]